VLPDMKFEPLFGSSKNLQIASSRSAIFLVLKQDNGICDTVAIRSTSAKLNSYDAGSTAEICAP